MIGTRCELMIILRTRRCLEKAITIDRQITHQSLFLKQSSQRTKKKKQTQMDYFIFLWVIKLHFLTNNSHLQTSWTSELSCPVGSIVTSRTSKSHSLATKIMSVSQTWNLEKKKKVGGWGEEPQGTWWFCSTLRWHFPQTLELMILEHLWRIQRTTIP